MGNRLLHIGNIIVLWLRHLKATTIKEIKVSFNTAFQDSGKLISEYSSVREAVGLTGLSRDRIEDTLYETSA